MTIKHTNLKKYTLVKLSQKCRVWQNETGTALSMDGVRIIKYGKIGSPDIIGWIKSSGKFIGVEIKIPPDDLRPEQIIFMENCILDGVHFHVVRSKEEADALARNIL